MTLSFASPADPALDLHVIAQPDLEDWLLDKPDQVASWVAANGFTGTLGQSLIVPQADGSADFVLAGYGSSAKRGRKRFPLAAAAEALPTGTYRIASGLPEAAAEMECLGWLLTGYAFDRYASQSPDQGPVDRARRC